MTAARRRPTGKSQLLEQCVEALLLLNFQIYDSLDSFRRAHVVGERYVIRNYPHPSLYGTPGKKEALIVVSKANGLPMDEDGFVRIIVEAKWQEGSGSVDEKLPYVWEAASVSPVKNWIIILDGGWWKAGRGKAAANWLTARSSAQEPNGHTFKVTDRRGFNSLARHLWGRHHEG